MKTIISVIGTVLLAGACSVAMADEHKMTASFLPGLSIPVGGLYASNANSSGSRDDGMKPSLATAIAVDYQLHESFALGLEVGHDWKHPVKEMPSGQDGDEISLWQVTPYAKYSFHTIGKFTPYGILGLGLYSFHQNARNAGTTEMYAARTLNYLGFNIGGGATYALAKDWEIGLDLRWHHVFSGIQMDDQGNNSSSFVSLNNFTPSVKVQYAFSI